MTEVKPFKIHVPEEVLSDLRERLMRTRFPSEIPGSGWDYGTNLAYLKQLVEYWRDRYEWRKHESELNRLTHFKVSIDGLDLHFIHEPGRGPNPMPLLLSHGWPGSVYEFMQIIPMLTDPAAHALVAGIRQKQGDLDGALADTWLAWKLMQRLDSDVAGLESELAQAHILKKTLFVLTADHGMLTLHHSVPHRLIENAVQAAGTSLLSYEYHSAGYLWIKDRDRAPQVAAAIAGLKNPFIRAVYYRRPGTYSYALTPDSSRSKNCPARRRPSSNVVANVGNTDALANAVQRVAKPLASLSVANRRQISSSATNISRRSIVSPAKRALGANGAVRSASLRATVGSDILCTSASLPTPSRIMSASSAAIPFSSGA